MFHLTLNSIYHQIYHLGNPENQYLTAITKVQGSSLLVCTDSILRRLYLFDLRRDYGPYREEVYDYNLDDLAVSSAPLIDEHDGMDVVCGDICIDLSGHNLYALLIKMSGGAWIKIYKVLKRKIYFTGVKYAVPFSLDYHAMDTLTRDTLTPSEGLAIPDIEYYKDTGLVASRLSHDLIGSPYPYNALCYGSGLEIKDGRLYILTRRTIPFGLYTALSPKSLQYDESTIEVSLLSVVMPHNGEPLSHFLLSIPSIEGDEDGDGVFHGLTKLDGQLMTQVRYDHNALRPTASQWPLGKVKTRGQTVFALFDDPIEFGAPKMSVLPYTILHNHFPYGIAMAYSITTDQADRKLYTVWGNQVWDFDIMDYTLIVRYPEYDDEGNLTGYIFFEGDIIDLGNIIKDDVRTELQCFLRNDSSHDMIDTKITLELDGKDKRLDDIFISLTQTSFGYKHLDLGTIVPGGSKEFWVETHPLNVGQIELNKTHRLPLRVTYQTTFDEY